MASKFIIVGNCRGNEYYLKWEDRPGHRLKWSWEGLKENASIFTDFDEALNVQGKMSEFGKIPCMVSDVSNYVSIE